jgi:cell division transport system ATP-binding protein
MSQPELTFKNVMVYQENNFILREINLDDNQREFSNISGNSRIGKSNFLKNLHTDLSLFKDQSTFEAIKKMV